MDAPTREDLYQRIDACSEHAIRIAADLLEMARTNQRLLDPRREVGHSAPGEMPQQGRNSRRDERSVR